MSTPSQITASSGGAQQPTRLSKQSDQVSGAASSTPSPATDAAQQDPALQGEGNYTASRRHRESVEHFIESGAVEDAARDAAPDSAEEARDMKNAEAEGLSHARR